MPVTVVGLAPLLQVFDMPASLRFYRDTLGFEVAADSGKGDESGWVLLRLNGIELMLNTAYDEGERPSEPDANRIGGHGDTGLFFSCPDVDATYQYLKSEGLDMKPPHVTSYGMKQLYAQDPDGFGLCFQWRAS